MSTGAGNVSGNRRRGTTGGNRNVAVQVATASVVECVATERGNTGGNRGRGRWQLWVSLQERQLSKNKTSSV